jgi:diguanylate cyclase (GGDEF)-like protein
MLTPGERRARDWQAFLRRLADLAPVLLLAAIYFIAARFGLLFAIEPGYATAVWLPSGIALAALLLFGDRLWPGVWLGALFVNLAVESSFAASLLISVGNTLEATVAASLVRRHIGTARVFVKGVDVLKFGGIAAVCAMIAASVATLPLATLNGLRDWVLLANWWTWWQGDAAGIMIVTPLVMSWRTGELPWSAARVAELVALEALLLSLTLLAFGASPIDSAAVMLPFLVLPLIIWAAYRFGQRELTASLALVCVTAAWFTLAGQGPFARSELNLAMLMLLAFFSSVVFTGLLLNAALRERSRAHEALGRALENVRELALTDPLTGLYNRRLLQDALPREIGLAERRAKPLAVIMLDLDYFKRINDSSGHEAGDFALIAVAGLLKRHVRSSDIACRFGGEEFVLVLPDATLESALRKAEELRTAIAQLGLRYRGALLGVTASLGVAVYPKHALRAEALLRAADEALYAAKGAGRNYVVASEARPQAPLEALRGKPA